MTIEQELWWFQARSDFELSERLRGMGVGQCHLLHYLQMTTEKLSKAYLWRSGHPPPKTHVGFVRFLRALLDRRSEEISRIASVLGFADAMGLENWISKVLPLAYSVQSLAPAEAGDGPNAEYPWPHATPTTSPVNFSFPTWDQLANTGQGRRLLQFVRVAVQQFAQIA
jgi:hypothetical protein